MIDLDGLDVAGSMPRHPRHLGDDTRMIGHGDAHLRELGRIGNPLGRQAATQACAILEHGRESFGVTFANGRLEARDDLANLMQAL